MITLVISNFSGEGVNDAGGLDADMDDARDYCDEIARVFKPCVCVVADAAVLFGGRDFVSVDKPRQRGSAVDDMTMCFC